MLQIKQFQLVLIVLSVRFAVANGEKKYHIPVIKVRFSNGKTTTLSNPVDQTLSGQLVQGRRILSIARDAAGHDRFAGGKRRPSPSSSKARTSLTS